MQQNTLFGCNRCMTAWDRARGLLAREPLQLGAALWIEPCSSIHMLGMTYAIDVAYLARDGTVLKVVKQVKPWRFSFCSGAQTTVEMAVGQIERSRLIIGSKLSWVDAL